MSRSRACAEIYDYALLTASGVGGPDGIDLHARDSEGTPALHWLLRFRSRLTPSVEFIDAIVRDGYDLDARDATGATLLHLAAAAGELDDVDLLLARGASTTDASGRRPVDCVPRSKRTLRERLR